MTSFLLGRDARKSHGWRLRLLAVGLVSWAIVGSAHAAILQIRAQPLNLGGLVTVILPSGTTHNTDNVLTVNVPNGTNATISASYYQGYGFVGWSVMGNGTVSNALSDLTGFWIGSGTIVLTAEFQKPQVTLTMQNDGNGVTFPTSPASYPYDQGTRISISATPNGVPAPGYIFDRWTGGAGGIYDSTAALTAVDLDNNMTVKAFFKRQYYVTQKHDDGPTEPTPGGDSVTTVVAGQVFRAEPAQTVVQSGASQRYRVSGWNGGSGNIPSTGAGSFYDIENASANSSVNWLWDAEYRLSVTNNAGGTAFPSGPTWHENGEVVTVSASPEPGFTFGGWSGTLNGSATNSRAVNFSFTMTAAGNLTALFLQAGADNDGDQLPDQWEERFGLDPADNGSINVNNGRNGDPDNDGLSNYQEYLVAFTNLDLYCNPVHSDTDGDGMDDYFEVFFLRETNNVNDDVIPAALDAGSRDAAGPVGNPDRDTLWNTANGYIMTNVPLRNIDEYIGPDGKVPASWPPLVFGNPGYPFASNDGNHRPTVYRYVVNGNDTGDQSKPQDSDTDNDGFDDGFEYSWDIWHQDHANEFIAATNFWPGITNKVPVWSAVPASARRFHPNNAHPDPSGSLGDPDFDRWYNQDTAGIGDYFSDMQEYRASDFAEGTVTVYPIVRLFPPPGEPPWCTNPFKWDTDGDGMPDGWEISFGFDPWDTDSDDDGVGDGDENPDNDWYAVQGNLRHSEVYIFNGFHPGTAYQYIPPEIDEPGLHPNTEQYVNLEEIRGTGTEPDLLLTGTNSAPTHPHSIDTDGDGIWDGWESYVGLDAADIDDGGLDEDPPAPPPGDGLSNFDEFNSWATSTNVMGARYTLADWSNKTHPTDPWDKDTDDDQITDGGEKAVFNETLVSNEVVTVEDGQTGEILYFHSVGGGLNPTTVDTDSDSLPDAWEAVYAGSLSNDTWVGGMSGTESDYELDSDGDGLLNYQEYMCGAVYHWQYLYNNGGQAWTAGRGLYGYEPYDFFDVSLSSNRWYQGGGALQPRYWDPHAIVGPIWHPVEFRFLGAAVKLSGLWYSTTDPSNPDTDLDGMDDFWEVYHGLNPLFGIEDVVLSKVLGGHVLAERPDASDPDLEKYPWIAGDQLFDADQDEIPNVFESLQTGAPEPPYYHSDPSPVWMTDTSSEESWVNLYYWLGSVFGNQYEWYWDEDVLALASPPPTYLFSFEINEGFDTDGDHLADRAELVHDPVISPGSTDLLDSQSPIKRRALYLNGDAAARTRQDHLHLADDFRTFTVEMWVRAENPASGVEQVLIERTAYIPTNSLGVLPGRRANFRISLDADGRPFAGYNGSGDNLIFVDAKAGAADTLIADEWYHLACTFDGAYNTMGAWNGILKFYINGAFAASTPSSEIPANGWFGALGQAAIGFYLRMPIVVGASDDNPAGWIDNAPVRVGYWAGVLLHDEPQLDKHFQGWVDQIRIWDGARSQGDIQAAMPTRLSRPEINRLASTNQLAGSPLLRYAYTFDDLPDTDSPVPEARGTVAPVGFSVINWPAFHTGIDWWANSSVRSLIYNDYRYLPWVENLVQHVGLNPPRDSSISSSNRYPNTSNPYGFVYKHGLNIFDEFNPHLANAGGLISESIDPQNDAHYNDLLPLRYAVADEDIEMWDGGGVPATDPFDSDGDGLPDDWETGFGLDPFDATGDNGMSGDPDLDGLNNYAEYLAGTDPLSFDTDGDGRGDYDDVADPNNAYGLTFGELYTDNDGMDDTWEALFSGSLSTLEYDAHEDPDEDCWSNFAEFFAQTDPTDPTSHPEPTIRGRVRYDGTQASGPVQVLAYPDARMDGEAIVGASGGGQDLDSTEVIGLGDGSTKVFSGQLQHGNIVRGSVKVRRLNPLFLTPDNDFEDDVNGNWIFWTYYLYNEDGTDLVDFDYSTGEYTFTWPPQGDDRNLWDAPWAGDTIFIDYTWSDADPNSYSVIAPCEGDMYIFAYRDTDGNGTFNDNEPAGAYQYGPIDVRWGNIDGIELGLTDHLPGYGRFAWTDTGAAEYDIVIKQLNPDNQPRTLTRTIRGPRTYFHEGDAWYDDQFGLEALGHLVPNYRWYVNGPWGGDFTNDWRVPLSAPTGLAPAGSTLYYAKNTFSWAMDRHATRFRIEIRPDSTANAPIIDDLYVPPYRDASGRYTFMLPYLAGGSGFDDGVYHWRIQALNPESTSPWSAFRSFTLNLEDTVQGVYSIAGEVNYYGKTTAGKFIVQAFENTGFSGMPNGQATLANKGDFDLRGLRADIYYLFGFLDLNLNGVLDFFESYGFVKRGPSQYANEHEAAPISVPPSATGIELIIRDRDTDQDKLPDSWEWQMWGNLTSAGPGPVRGYTDSDGDGLNDLEEYETSALDSDPRDPDTDDDGLTDYEEVMFNGVLDDYDPYHPVNNTAGTDTDVLNPDTDGDTLSDGYEVNVFGTSPIDPDDDGDGVPTAVELAWDGSGGYSQSTDMDPRSADTDGDLVSDLMELAAGTDPCDPAQSGMISIDAIGIDIYGFPQVQWQVYSNVTGVSIRYELEFAGDLRNPGWQSVGSVVSVGNADADVMLPDEQSVEETGFYRLRLSVEK